MIEFLTADQNMLFAIILTIVGIFFVIELLGVLVGGLDIAGLLEGVLPDIEIDIDVDAGIFSKILGWIKYKEVPLILAVFIFMGTLSIIGYTIQYVCYQGSAYLFPWWVPTLISVIPSILVTKTSTAVIGKFITQEDKWVLKKDDLVGKCGIVTTGTAREGLPAEAKVSDQYGKQHYIRVVPQDPNLSFPEKTAIITTRLDKNVYKVIEDKDPV